MNEKSSRLTEWWQRLDRKLDDKILAIRERLDLIKPLQIVTYRSYGTRERLHVRGRVLMDKGIKQGTADDSTWSNLVNMYKRLDSDEIPGAELELTFAGETHHIFTDQEGFFKHDMAPAVPLSAGELHHEAVLKLIGGPIPVPEGLMAKADIVVPPEDAEFGVISDIDDTIVESSATSFLKMSKTALFSNARTRLPFAGTTAFYRALILGKNGKRNNPFFYVSSSPWNLYDMLTDYLDVQKLPKGPLLLRNIGIDQDALKFKGHLGHKMYQIDNILLTYPNLKFVLIGDSGQEDPAIYREVVKKYPTRILAIYIRDVMVPERKQIASRISEEMKTGGSVEMIIAENSLRAAEHAAQIGLIEAFRLEEIRLDKRADEALSKDPEVAIEQQEKGEVVVPEKHE